MRPQHLSECVGGLLWNYLCLQKKNLFLSKLLGANLQIFSVQIFKSSSCRIIFRDKPQIFVNISGKRLLQRGPGIPSIALGHQGILKQGRKLLACQKCVDMLMGQWWQPQQNWVIIFAFAVFRMTPRFESWLQVCVRCKHLCIYHILFMIQTLLKKTNKHKTTTKALSWAGVLVVGWCAVRVFACLFLEREGQTSWEEDSGDWSVQTALWWVPKVRQAVCT